MDFFILIPIIDLYTQYNIGLMKQKQKSIKKEEGSITTIFSFFLMSSIRAK